MSRFIGNCCSNYTNTKCFTSCKMVYFPCSCSILARTSLQQIAIRDILVSNWLIVVLITIRLGIYIYIYIYIHVSATITSDPLTLLVCKQVMSEAIWCKQQIASDNKLLYNYDTLIPNWLIIVKMTIRLGTNVSHNTNSEATTFHHCKQQIVSGNKLLL